MKRRVINSGLITAVLAMIVCVGCSLETDPGPEYILPYPDDSMLEFYQSRIDSSEFEWFLDVKGTASSFANEMVFLEDGVSTSSVIIKGEGIFHALAEVELPDKIYRLTMERPFKHLGRKSIWRIIKVETMEWPKK